jgi:hypothetical protein
MSVLLIVLLVTGITAQIPNPNQCTCSCCVGQSCQPGMVGTVSVQNCTAEMCLAQCRCTYPQCAANPPYGQLLAQCVSPVYLSTCQCLCCNTGSISCMPTFVGYATAYQCQPVPCSIACYKQYPSQCVADQNGQTQGTCIGPVSTTPIMTTIAPWLGNICSCLYCQSGYTCTSNLLLGVASASQCSPSDCTVACQNRYPLTCSTLYLSQISGVCLIQGSGRNRCKCNCCGGTGCIDYELNTNETCSTCNVKCQQVSPCMNSRLPTSTCVINNSIITTNFSLTILFLTLIIVMIFLK